MTAKILSLSLTFFSSKTKRKKIGETEKWV